MVRLENILNDGNIIGAIERIISFQPMLLCEQTHSTGILGLWAMAMAVLLSHAIENPFVRNNFNSAAGTGKLGTRECSSQLEQGILIVLGNKSVLIIRSQSSAMNWPPTSPELNQQAVGDAVDAQAAHRQSKHTCRF